MKFGVLANSFSVEGTIDLAKAAEEHGFDFVWLPDHNPAFPYRDVIVQLTAIALSTESINIGCGVANPYSRHIALTGIQFASLAELCGSKRTIVLGLGTGYPAPLAPLGIKMWEKPMSTLRDSVEILRKLFRGESVNYESELFKLRNVKFFGPVDVPIYLAARGPMMSKLAGEISDGVIFNPPLDAISYGIENVKMGLQISKKKEFEFVNYVPIALSRNFDIYRPWAALYFMTAPPPVLEKLGMLKLAEEVGKLWKAGNIEQVTKLITDDIFKNMFIAGTPDQCIETIQKQLDFGVTQLVFLMSHYTIKPLPTVADLVDTIKKISDEIIPSFK